MADPGPYRILVHLDYDDRRRRAERKTSGDAAEQHLIGETLSRGANQDPIVAGRLDTEQMF